MPEGNYACPRCGSHLIWTHNGAPGQVTYVICGNNPAASRIDFKFSEIRFCFWEGVCEKNKKGKIFFRNKDGSHLRKRYNSS